MLMFLGNIILKQVTSFQEPEHLACMVELRPFTEPPQRSMTLTESALGAAQPSRLLSNTTKESGAPHKKGHLRSSAPTQSPRTISTEMSAEHPQ